MRMGIVMPMEGNRQTIEKSFDTMVAWLCIIQKGMHFFKVLSPKTKMLLFVVDN
jgi:hypothetical protein